MSPFLVRSLAILLNGWTAACICGFGFLWMHSNKEGERGAVPATWPVGSDIDFAGDRRQLLVFIHPHCPCTRATLTELRRTIASQASPVRVVVVAIEAGPNEGTEPENVSLARSIDGAEIYLDVTGAEAARFGAKTSGHALLYSGDGRLQFQGGVTPSRGHEGPSAGSEAIRQILASRMPALRATAVFGCSLPSSSAPASSTPASTHPDSRTPRP